MNHPETAPASLSVVVPAYREAATIEESLERMLSVFDALGREYEIIVVSDGNVDGTEERATAVESPHVRVLHYERNQGKGFALRHGIAHAKNQLIGFLDADLDIHPDGIARFLRLLEAKGAHAVVASKIHPESRVHYPMFRRLQSRAFRLLVEILYRLDVSDTQTGLKLFRREVLDACMPFVQSDGFAFDLELLVLANDAGYVIVEGPVELDFNFSSTTGPGAVLDVLRDVLSLFMSRRRRRRVGDWVPIRAHRHRHR